MELTGEWQITEQVVHELGRGDPFAAAVRATRMPMIITDPRQQDNPIVFANDAFLQLAGYDRDEIMGKNCRFLQGPDTDQHAVERIREALAAGRDINTDLLNYRKDGTPFWNALYISPVISAQGEVQFFFASQLDVTDRKDALAAKTALLHEVDHRVKNNLQMISALITMQVKAVSDPEIRRSLTTMIRRVEALSTVHRRLYQSEDVSRFSVDDFVRDIVTELVGASGRENITIRLELEAVTVPAEKASPLALIVNEIVTNALKHGLPPGRAGALTVLVARNGEHLHIVIEDDGVGMPPKQPGPSTSFGMKLVRTLARQVSARLVWSAIDPSGTRVMIDMPIEQLAPGA